jgi:hypothetical protein
MKPALPDDLLHGVLRNYRRLLYCKLYERSLQMFDATRTRLVYGIATPEMYCFRAYAVEPFCVTKTLFACPWPRGHPGSGYTAAWYFAIIGLSFLRSASAKERKNDKREKSTYRSAEGKEAPTA